MPKVLGNKRDLPGALGESELIQMMGLNSVQVHILLESMIMVIKLMIMVIKLMIMVFKLVIKLMIKLMIIVIKRATLALRS